MPDNSDNWQGLAVNRHERIFQIRPSVPGTPHTPGWPQGVAGRPAQHCKHDLGFYLIHLPTSQPQVQQATNEKAAAWRPRCAYKASLTTALLADDCVATRQLSSIPLLLYLILAVGYCNIRRQRKPCGLLRMLAPADTEAVLKDLQDEKISRAPQSLFAS